MSSLLQSSMPASGKWNKLMDSMGSRLEENRINYKKLVATETRTKSPASQRMKFLLMDNQQPGKCLHPPAMLVSRSNQYADQTTCNLWEVSSLTHLRLKEVGSTECTKGEGKGSTSLPCSGGINHKPDCGRGDGEHARPEHTAGPGSAAAQSGRERSGPSPLPEHFANGPWRLCPDLLLSSRMSRCSRMSARLSMPQFYKMTKRHRVS